MSLRPRHAADGRLRLPERLELVHRDGPYTFDEYVGRIGQDDRDPFERTADDLLLAESFARLDLADPDATLAWLSRNGAVALGTLFPEDLATVLMADRDRLPVRIDDIGETASEIGSQQLNVRWHLATLARLSEHRERAGAARPPWAPHEGWDPRWVQPVLLGPDGQALWLGGSRLEEALILGPMRTHPTLEAFRASGGGRLDTPRGIGEARLAAWWPVAHATWARLRSEGQVTLWVPEDAWHRTWRRWDAAAPPDGRDPRGRLSSDWHGMLELQRRLIEPWVVRASERQLSIAREVSFSDPAAGPAETRWGQRLEIRETRRWGSVLAPVYLQLLEALLRISEGQAGAARCRECGKAFLTLDARRSVFCTDRERYRYNQRQHRRRLKRITITDDLPGDERLEAAAEEHTREHPVGAEEDLDR